MNLSTAQRYADHITGWLAPYCQRLEVAGSIRRERPVCNDVDIVAIPKLDVKRDMFGVAEGERNLLWEFLAAHVAAGKAAFKSGGNQPGKFAILQLPKCQLDVFFARPETWASRLLCRTGSKEHNIWLAERCLDQGKEWKPYEGIWVPKPFNRLMQFHTEEEIYAFLDLTFIDPRNREQGWIHKNLEFGL